MIGLKGKYYIPFGSKFVYQIQGAEFYAQPFGDFIRSHLTFSYIATSGVPDPTVGVTVVYFDKPLVIKEVKIIGQNAYDSFYRVVRLTFEGKPEKPVDAAILTRAKKYADYLRDRYKLGKFRGNFTKYLVSKV